MRMIGTVADENQAQRFSNYLLSLKIDAHIEESTRGDWQVWVEHDDDLDAGKLELDAFRASPDDVKYASAETAAKQIRRERQDAEARRRRNFTDVRTSAAWSGIGGRGTPVAITLIFITLLVFVLQYNTRTSDGIYNLLSYDEPNYEIINEGTPAQQLVMPRQSMFESISHGQVWRAVTPIFLHFGWMHIIFNMMWLWRFGQVIESLKGSVFFLILVLVIAAFSCTAEAGWATIGGHWQGFGGMSGVNAGLFGFAWMKRKFQPYERIYVTDQELGLMLGWLVICSLGIVGNIANAAHWGGLLIGMAIGAAAWWRKKLFPGK